METLDCPVQNVRMNAWRSEGCDELLSAVAFEYPFGIVSESFHNWIENITSFV